MTTTKLEQYNLEFWIHRRGLTVAEFADAVSVSVQATYRWLRGGKVTERRKRTICNVLLVVSEQVLWPTGIIDD